MITNRIRLLTVLIVMTSFIISHKAHADAIASPDIQAVIIMKLLNFHNGINKGGNINIYVMGAPDFANAMKKAVGRKIGASTISKVEQGGVLPSDKPAVLYIGKKASISSVIDYARSNKVLTVSGIPGAVEQGISLGVVVADNKPKILLNIKASKQEGVNWNPAILKVASTVN